MTDLRVTYRGVIVPDRYHNNLDRAEFANFKLGVDIVLDQTHGLRTAKYIHQDRNLSSRNFRYEQPDGTWRSEGFDPTTYTAAEATGFLSAGIWKIISTGKR